MKKLLVMDAKNYDPNMGEILKEGEQAWNRREYTVLKLISEHLNH